MIRTVEERITTSTSIPRAHIEEVTRRTVDDGYRREEGAETTANQFRYAEIARQGPPTRNL